MKNYVNLKNRQENTIMLFEDFKVGQTVRAISMDITGVVTDICYPYITFLWENDLGYRKDCKNPKTFHDIELIRDVATLPTKDRVSIKAKLLWNNSQYVKKNPQLAY